MKTDFMKVELGQARLFWQLIRSRQLSHLSLEVFFGQLGMKIVKYDDKILIIGQNYILYAPNIFELFNVISSTDSMDASHATEQGSLLPTLVL